ncbi:MAG: tRNA (adenosine(37)-N6)-threonylcarbamoyltransferase complex dimerization subunit type 1 TsaB [Elusimicrobiota bacterium]
MKKDKNFLVIDTSTDNFLAVAGRNKKVLAKEVVPGRKHSEKLLPTVKYVLEESNLNFENLDILGAGKGPGSFTGIRVGLSCIMTLGQYLDIPVYGFSLLDIMGMKVSNPVLKAYRDKYFTARYDDAGTRISEYSIISGTEHPDIDGGKVDVNAGEVLKEVVKIDQNSNSFKSWKTVQPVYIMETVYKPR